MRCHRRAICPLLMPLSTMSHRDSSIRGFQPNRRESQIHVRVFRQLDCLSRTTTAVVSATGRRGIGPQRIRAGQACDMRRAHPVQLAACINVRRPKRDRYAVVNRRTCAVCDFFLASVWRPTQISSAAAPQGAKRQLCGQLRTVSRDNLRAQSNVSRIGVSGTADLADGGQDCFRHGRFSTPL
jgi:hypothetical protein